jgi:hypothetical protein
MDKTPFIMRGRDLNFKVSILLSPDIAETKFHLVRFFFCTPFTIAFPLALNITEPVAKTWL